MRQQQDNQKEWMSIDFGTSSSAVAITKNGVPTLVSPTHTHAAGAQIFPTVAFVDSKGAINVCHDAELMKNHDLSRYVREFKLDIAQQEKRPIVGVTYTQIVTKILRHLKIAAETAAKKTIDNVVLTIPAIYNDVDVRREVMINAAREAGFTQVELLKEAEAAAIYYDFIEGNCSGKTLAYDLGGGTFDPAIIEHSSAGYHIVGVDSGIEVGGKFFTEKITRHYIGVNNIDVKNTDINDIISKCESIKCYLSDNAEGEFPVENGKSYRLSRKEFETLIEKMIDSTLQSCDTIMSNAHFSWDQIDRILLIGGSCNIPLVRKRIEHFIQGKEKNRIKIIWRETESGKPINPQFAVALGGAVFAIKLMTPFIPVPPQIGYLSYVEDSNPQNSILSEGENRIGRYPGNTNNMADILIKATDKKMSRIHFSIHARYDAPTNKYIYTLKDCNSLNGTYIIASDGKPSLVTSEVILENQWIIKAGSTEIELNL